MRVCTKCGTENVDEANNCGKCGVDFSGGSFGHNFVQVKNHEAQELPLFDLPNKIVREDDEDEYEEIIDEKYYKMAKSGLAVSLVAFLFINPWGTFGVFSILDSMFALIKFKNVHNRYRRYCIAGIIIGFFATFYWFFSYVSYQVAYWSIVDKLFN